MSACVVVAIGGPSGAGKSTLADALAVELEDTAILRQDWFFQVGADVDPGANFCAPEHLDWSAFLAALGRLAAGRPAMVPEADECTFRVTGTRTLAPARWLIVEGMTVLRCAEARVRYDRAFYVTAPDATIMRRKRHRDSTVRNHPADVTDAQMAWVHAEHRRDLAALPHGVVLLNGDVAIDKLVTAVCSYLVELE